MSTSCFKSDLKQLFYINSYAYPQIEYIPGPCMTALLSKLMSHAIPLPHRHEPADHRQMYQPHVYCVWEKDHQGSSAVSPFL